MKKEKKNKLIKFYLIKLKGLINGVKTFESNIFIAYEPVWSIGTGIIPKSKK